MTRSVRDGGPLDAGGADDDTRPARRGPLSDELQGLSAAARRVWEDPAYRRRIIREILDAEIAGDVVRMRQGLGQIDAAISEALTLLGLPRGPISDYSVS